MEEKHRWGSLQPWHLLVLLDLWWALQHRVCKKKWVKSAEPHGDDVCMTLCKVTHVILCLSKHVFNIFLLIFLRHCSPGFGHTVHADALCVGPHHAHGCWSRGDFLRETQQYLHLLRSHSWVSKISSHKILFMSLSHTRALWICFLCVGFFVSSVPCWPHRNIWDGSLAVEKAMSTGNQTVSLVSRIIT